MFQEPLLFDELGALANAAIAAGWQPRSRRPELLFRVHGGGARTLLVVSHDPALVVPVLLALAATLARPGVASVVRALLVRHAGVSALFVGLIGLAVGIGLAVLVQERGLRAGSARRPSTSSPSSGVTGRSSSAPGP